MSATATEEPQSPPKTESQSETQSEEATPKASSDGESVVAAATEKLSTPVKPTVESSEASESKSRSESTPTPKTPERNGAESTGKPRGTSLTNNSGDKKSSAKKQVKQTGSAKKDAKENSSKADEKNIQSGEKDKTSDGEIVPATSLDPKSNELEQEKSSTDVPAEQIPPETASNEGDVRASFREESNAAAADDEDAPKQTEPTTGIQVQDENRKPEEGERRDRPNYRGGYRNKGDHQRRGRRGYTGPGQKSPPTNRANSDTSKGPSDEVAEGEGKQLEGDDSSKLLVSGQEESESAAAAAGGRDDAGEGEIREKKGRQHPRRGRSNRYNDRPGFYAARQYPPRSSRPGEGEAEAQGDEDKAEKSTVDPDKVKETGGEVSAGEDRAPDASGKKKRRKPRKPRSRSKSVGSIEGEQVKQVELENGYNSQDETSNQRETSPGRRRQYYNRGGGGGGGGGYRGGRGGYYRHNYQNHGNFYRPRPNFTSDPNAPAPMFPPQDRVPGQAPFFNNPRGAGYQPRPFNQQQRSYYNYNRGGHRGAGGPVSHVYDRSNPQAGSYRGGGYRRGEGGRPGYSQNRRHQNMEAPTGDFDYNLDPEVGTGKHIPI